MLKILIIKFNKLTDYRITYILSLSEVFFHLLNRSCWIQKSNKVVNESHIYSPREVIYKSSRLNPERRHEKVSKISNRHEKVPEISNR